jgi:5-methylcytosine-specific restriction endonuclease McrA
VDTRRQANQRRWWRAVIEATPVTCEWCGYPITPDQAWHLDHTVPVSAGGTDDPSNLTPMHAPCNLAKAAQTMQPRPVTPAPPSRKW